MYLVCPSCGAKDIFDKRYGERKSRGALRCWACLGTEPPTNIKCRLVDVGGRVLSKDVTPDVIAKYLKGEKPSASARSQK